MSCVLGVVKHLLCCVLCRQNRSLENQSLGLGITPVEEEGDALGKYHMTSHDPTYIVFSIVT